MMEEQEKIIEWAKRETDEALKEFKTYYGLANDSLLTR